MGNEHFSHLNLNLCKKTWVVDMMPSLQSYGNIMLAINNVMQVIKMYLFFRFVIGITRTEFSLILQAVNIIQQQIL
jgi:hypothetical protein